ncbi:hypothetical protein LCGC14_0560400 [marine sediment metagenome]|uniref:Uncharacterized protein n=1 Tax=marine sediment metagenome TaxID=412755 RepID=A0A0F9S5Z9_9ZZZZ
MIKKINLLTNKIIKEYSGSYKPQKQEFEDSWSYNKLISIKNSLKSTQTNLSVFFGIKK